MKHISIAICDDDKMQVSLTEKMIETIAAKRCIDIDISVFYDGSTLREYYKKGNRFDILYLDIRMNKLDGIEVAKYIRQIDLSLIIIYLSGYESYLLKLFEVEPFRFIKKPIDPIEFEEIFCKAYRKIIRNPIYYTYKYRKMIHKVLLNDVMYFESRGRIISIMLTNGNVETFYGKLDNVENDLSEAKISFLRIHQSYLVNFIYVKEMNFSKIVLINGKELTISEERQKYIRKMYLKILGVLCND